MRFAGIDDLAIQVGDDIADLDSSALASFLVRTCVETPIQAFLASATGG